MASADYNRIIPWADLLHPDLATTYSLASNAQTTLSTTASLIAIPLNLVETSTIDKVEVYLASGVSTNFRCRIVTESVGLPTSTLVHANASASLSVSGAGWKVFDFTDFSLAAGCYWIVLDSTVTPSTSVAVQYTTINSNAQFGLVPAPLYYTGSALAPMNAGNRALRVRMKTTDGWHRLWPCSPLGPASGLNPLVMDTAENPNCRGNRFVAPMSGTIVGAAFSIGLYNSGTSFEVVLADQGCSSELARREQFYSVSASLRGMFFMEFCEAVSVSAGTSYDLYVTAGSAATSSAGPWISALDTSEDSGNVIQCYGVVPGEILGMYVHNPPTEGGSGSVTTTANHVFPLIPIFGSVTSGGGGGGGGVPVAFST